MPPKKGGESKGEDGVLLGRPGNHVTMGVVGMPNVGKSSFFNLLSKLNVPAENFPFCTIDPNVAQVPLHDKRFDKLVEVYKPKSVVPAVLKVTDIAGLIAGASEGEGLGNAFLSHIAAVDSIFHMVRAFEDADVAHVEDSVDPIRDMDIIHGELRAKDLQQVNRLYEPAAALFKRKSTDKALKKEVECLTAAKEWLEAGNDIRTKKDWSVHMVEWLNTQLFLSAKPMIYLVNVSKRGYIKKGNKWLPQIAEYVAAKGNGERLVPFSCSFEQEYLDAETGGEDAMKAFMEESEGTDSALKMITKLGYKSLSMMHYFTAGADEVRAWSIRDNTKAPQAAGVIHTDFEKGFICVDTFSFKDLKAKKFSEKDVKAAGQVLQNGKNYVVKDGDILHFKFNN
jgi:obg-like ATPase 1